MTVAKGTTDPLTVELRELLHKVAELESRVAEHQQIEEALRGSKEKYSKAFNLTPDAVIISQIVDGIILEVNNAWECISGYSRAEVIGKSPLALGLIRASDRQRAVSLLEEQGLFHEFEAEIVRKSGEVRQVVLSAEKIDIYGTRCMITTVHDITERLQTKKELFESEERFRSIYDHTMDGIIIADLETETIYGCNESMCRMLGYRTEEMKNMKIADIHPVEALQYVRERIEEQAKGEFSPVSDVPFQRKDGSVFLAEISSALISFAGRAYIAGICRDVTARKQAEQALAESEGKLAKIFESSPDGIVISRIADGTILEINGAWVRLLGYGREETLGKRSIALNILSPQERQRLVSLFKKQGSLREYELDVRRKSGDTCPVSLSIDGIEIGGEQCMLMTVRDITERKLLQEEQQKAARLESLGTLAGGIAHDFNNLLTGIMGNISMAKRHVGTDEMVLERLEEAENASLRARNLSQQLLTFSRGGAPIKKLVTLRNVIEDSAEFTLRGSKSRCEFSLPGDLWPIEIDEGQIGQVIDNLVINADQSMPEGGIIKIRAQNTVLTERDGVPLPEGRYVRVEIVDSGIGISPKHLHKIFEPYFTTKNKGSGLGLATSYSIVKNHSGYITAQSVEGAGTTLTMYFPASENPAPNEEETTKEKELTGEGRILVMDDEAIIRRMISSMLSSAGYEVELTSDGAEAIERYSQALETGKPFLAVIMDLTVPGGMGGKEAIRKLLEIDPDVKAIVSSGYSNDPIMSEYKTYGFRAVITKPYRIGDLERALHGLSGGNR